MWEDIPKVSGYKHYFRSQYKIAKSSLHDSTKVRTFIKLFSTSRFRKRFKELIQKNLEERVRQTKWFRVCGSKIPPTEILNFNSPLSLQKFEHV